MLNVLILMGRLTRDVELRKSGEIQIASLALATDNARVEKDGSRGTTFLPVTCFGTLAESAAKYTHKGSKVLVKGSIQQREYLNKDGIKVRVYEVIANSIDFLDPKPDEEKLPFDEDVKEEAKEEAPKFDPFTGKPLKESKK